MRSAIAARSGIGNARPKNSHRPNVGAVLGSTSSGQTSCDWPGPRRPAAGAAHVLASQHAAHHGVRSSGRHALRWDPGERYGRSCSASFLRVLSRSPIGGLCSRQRPLLLLPTGSLKVRSNDSKLTRPTPFDFSCPTWDLGPATLGGCPKSQTPAARGWRAATLREVSWPRHPLGGPNEDHRRRLHHPCRLRPALHEALARARGLEVIWAVVRGQVGARWLNAFLEAGRQAETS